MMNGLHLFVDNISPSIRGLSAHQGPMQGLVNHPGVREKENAFSQYDNRHSTEYLRAVSSSACSSPLRASGALHLGALGQCIPLCLLLYVSPWAAPLPLAENMTAVPLTTTCPGGSLIQLSLWSVLFPSPSGYCSSAALSNPSLGSSLGGPLAWSFLHVGSRSLGNLGSQRS